MLVPLFLFPSFVLTEIIINSEFSTSYEIIKFSFNFFLTTRWFIGIITNMFGSKTEYRVG